MVDSELAFEIWENRDRILSNLKKKDIDEYRYLKEKFESSGGSSDPEFQARFKKFYRLNFVGLSNKWKDRFFELLSAKCDDLKCILLELYGIRRLDGKCSVQCVFATKLVHTVNNDEPIYDSMVGEVLNRKVEGSNRDEKVDSCVEIHNFLMEKYRELINNSKVKEVISEFRSKFGVKREDVSDVKALDFIIWSLGKIKQNLKENRPAKNGSIRSPQVRRTPLVSASGGTTGQVNL